MRAALLVLAVFGFATVAGCATIRLPLCKDLAQTTYKQPPTLGGSDIGAYTWEVARRQHLELKALSPFAMDVTGAVWNLRRFQTDYPFLACSFDPDRVVIPRDTYLQCMGHIDEWTAIVQSGSPENLMLRETLYEATCASGEGGTH